MNSVDSVDNLTEPVDNLTEIVWCDHANVVPHPMVLSKVPHVYLKGGSYIIVEDRKVKIVCSVCWMKAIQPPPF